MYILGISSFYHDSPACILKNGTIIAAAQEERFTRKKHDQSFPSNAIKYCLKEAGISASDLEIVAFYDKPFLKFERILETYLTYAPRGLSSFLKAIPLWIKKKLWIKELIKDIKMAGVLKRKYQFLAHGTAVEQSGGHIFKRPETSFKKLHDALINTIKRYYLQHQNEDNEFIRSFPNKINFSSSWSIEMKSGGHLGAHNHPDGWVSGAIYLAVPKNNGTDGQEGGIELSSDFHQLPNLHDEFEKIIIVPNEGDVIFFPSPMYHRTIPFKSNEERICIAFDVKHDIRRFGYY